MNKTFLSFSLILCFCMALVIFPHGALAQNEDQISDLKQQIESLKQRVQQLESEKKDALTQGHFSNARSYQRAWDPFEEINQMQEMMDAMFHHSFSRMGQGPRMFSSNMSVNSSIDIQEKDKEYEVIFDMTGFDQDKVDLQINSNSITVKAQQSSEEKQEGPNGFFSAQSYGSFLKTIPVPTDADTTNVKTEKEGNKLIIHLPKKSS